MSDNTEKQVTKVEEDGELIDKMINQILKPYSADLDSYVEFIMNVLKDDEKPPTDTELDDFAVNLSTLIFFASVGCERLGVRDDLAVMHYKEVYNSIRTSLGKGTVADKNTEAELQAQEERVVSIVFNKAYKMMKAKVESAQEILSSVKKVITHRISDNELSAMQVNK